jgi:pilus assembly protein CpaE
VDVVLNLDSARDVSDLLPRLSRMDQRLVADILAPHASGVQVLLAPPPEDLSKPISLPQAQQMLVLLKRMFSWVIVDLGLPLDEMAYALLDGADLIIMSVLPEMVGLRNTRLMLDQLSRRGHPDEKIWMVLNRANMRGGVTVGDVKERLGVELRHTVPEDAPAATHSINRGVPLVMSHGRSAVARSVRRLAQQVIEELSQEAPSVGLMERLLRRARAENAEEW